MSNENHYIYLLQTREFINSKQSIYKVGRTKKEHLKRFEQYPKGSMLLLQIKCIDCKIIENIILKLFRENFEQKKDIGKEYFQGNYKSMIDIIYNIVKNESDNHISEIQDESDKNTIDPQDKSDKNAIESQVESDNDPIQSQHETEKDTHYQSQVESDKDTQHESENISNDEYDDSDKEENIYEITTYEEWSKYNNIQIIITDNKKGIGYFRFENELWRILYDEKSIDFDKKNMEHLLGVIQSNHLECVKNISSNEYISINEFYNLDETIRHQYQITNQYNDYKIYKDVIKKCYTKDCEFYDLNYNEYFFRVFNLDSPINYVMFDSINFTFTDINIVINNKILTKSSSGGYILVKNIINHTIVDDILNSLIGFQIKNEYKKLVYNCIVKQEHEIIFYDYNVCLLTIWLDYLLYSISKNGCAYSQHYYDNKTKFIEDLKKK